MNIIEKLGGRENRLIICLIKILIWLVKDSLTLGAMSSYLLIKILWIRTSHLLYLILSIMFLYLPWMVFLLHHLFVSLLDQKINLSVNLQKYLTLDETLGSAPGTNMIPYKVYKLCPNVCDYLFRLFKSCFQNCVVPVQWRIATEVYILKSGSPDLNNIKDFRPISLLNVEGKLSFSILSKQLVKHIYNSKLIN